LRHASIFARETRAVFIECRNDQSRELPFEPRGLLRTAL